MNLKDGILQDVWIHFAALIAIAIGAAAWYSRTGFHTDPSSVELMFMIGGLAGMGLKIVNGSAAALRTALIAQSLVGGQLPADRRTVAVVPSITVSPAPPAPPETTEGGTNATP